MVDSADEFELVENLGKLMIEQDPLSPFGYRTLGGWYRERFRRTHDKQHAKAAVGYLQRAVERYPNQAVFRAELADALVRSGKTRQAREQAERSLELDAINHREGHRDKFLPPPIVESLQGMLEGSHEKRTSPNRN